MSEGIAKIFESRASRQAAALKLHDAGYWVVPTNGKPPMKKAWPLVRMGRQELERDLAANRHLDIAIVLNQSELIDVEHDHGDKGEATVRQLFGGQIPFTATWTSPRGVHRLFRRPEGLPQKATMTIDGIEFRGLAKGKGAVSVVPPSGGRRWVWGRSLFEIEPAELPEHLVQRLRGAIEERPQICADGDIPETRRNETLFALACAMRRMGAGAASIELALTAENRDRCKPPLAIGEIRQIVKSALAYDSGANSFNYLIYYGEPPKLGSAAFYGIAGRAVQAIAPLTEAPEPAILCQLLAAAGMLIGPVPTIYAGTHQPARVNVMLAGPTSTGRKGTSFAHVDTLLRNLPDQGLRFKWRDRVARGLSSGEGLIAAVADYKEKDEETGKMETVHVDKRLLAVEPEFAKVLAHSKREGNILSHNLREAFDSGHLETLTRQNPLRVTGAHVVLIGHITPDELRKRLTELEMANGFCNRFLWLYVHSERLLPNAQPIPKGTIKPLAAELSAAISAAQKIEHVERDGEANELWRLVYPSLRAPRPGLRGAILARGETLVTRLALIYALLDNSPHLRRVHLEAALGIWAYAEESVSILFPDKTDGNSMAESLYTLLEGGPLPKSKLFPALNNPSKEELDNALTELRRAGRITRVAHKTGKAGRPAEIWQRT